jgi:hypothetical protein
VSNFPFVFYLLCRRRLRQISLASAAFLVFRLFPISVCQLDPIASSRQNKTKTIAIDLQQLSRPAAIQKYKRKKKQGTLPPSHRVDRSPGVHHIHASLFVRCWTTLAIRLNFGFVWLGAYASNASDQTLCYFLSDTKRWLLLRYLVCSFPQAAAVRPAHFDRDLLQLHARVRHHPSLAAAHFFCGFAVALLRHNFCDFSLPRYSFGELRLSRLFPNRVHIAYFSAPFGSHSHSLLTNIW